MEYFPQHNNIRNPDQHGAASLLAQGISELRQALLWYSGIFDTQRQLKNNLEDPNYSPSDHPATYKHDIFRTLGQWNRYVLWPPKSMTRGENRQPRSWNLEKPPSPNGPDSNEYLSIAEVVEGSGFRNCRPFGATDARKAVELPKALSRWTWKHNRDTEWGTIQ